MWICFTLLGKKRCFWIPIYYEKPIFRLPPDPGPYRGLFVDATILATIGEAAKHITDEKVRRTMQDGLAAGMKTMQAVAGDDFSISLEAPKEH